LLCPEVFPNIPYVIFLDEDDILTDEERFSLEHPFSEEDILNDYGAPGPDGFPFLFTNNSGHRQK
jgi:hypothetical protein